jgi:hypothetical protein
VVRARALSRARAMRPLRPSHLPRPVRPVTCRSCVYDTAATWLSHGASPSRATAARRRRLSTAASSPARVVHALCATTGASGCQCERARRACAVEPPRAPAHMPIQKHHASAASAWFAHVTNKRARGVINTRNGLCWSRFRVAAPQSGNPAWILRASVCVGEERRAWKRGESSERPRRQCV